MTSSPPLQNTVIYERGHPKITLASVGRGSTILLHIVTYISGGRGGILRNSYVTVDNKFENSKYSSNIFGAFLKASKGQV